MGAPFSTFHYDDGTRPFDPEAAFTRDTSNHEVPEVTVQGLMAIFDLRPEDLQDYGFLDPAFYPSFMDAFTPDADGPSEGIYENIHGESLTLPVNPTELKNWCATWLDTLQSLPQAERDELLDYDAKYYDNYIEDLSEIQKQAQYAEEHHLPLMLYVAW